MKILHLTSYFQPAMGYQEYFLAREQARIGDNVLVVTSNRLAPFVGMWKGGRRVKEANEIIDGIRVYRVPPLLEIGETYLVGRFIESALSSFKPDIIHVHEPHSLFSTFALRRSEIPPYVVDIHKFLTANRNVNEAVVNLIDGFSELLMIRKVICNASAIVAVTEACRSWLSSRLHIPYSKIGLIPLGADTDQFLKDEGRRMELRKRWGVSDSDAVLIMPGRVSPEKRIHLAIRAVGSLGSPYRNGICVVAVGGGDQRYLESCIRLARRLSVRFITTDYVQNRDMPGYLSAGDVAVWTNSLPISIWEAMACELPVVVPESFPGGPYPFSDYGKRFVQNDNGFTFSPSSIQDLASKILLLLDMRERQIRGKRSRELVVGSFSWHSIARQWQLLYESILRLHQSCAR